MPATLERVPVTLGQGHVTLGQVPATLGQGHVTDLSFSISLPIITVNKLELTELASLSEHWDRLTSHSSCRVTETCALLICSNTLAYNKETYLKISGSTRTLVG